MILVVDDDQAICTLVKTVLENQGYRVATAADGVEAFDLVKSATCRCVLLDMNMPRINGAELLLLMQAEGLKVPTIVMAGFEGFDEKELKEFGNVVHFLQKPFSMDDMLKMVKHALAAAATTGR